jgi:integrase
MPLASYLRGMTHTAPKWQAHPTCSHVFKRTGSDQWWIRLRSPTKTTEESLRTSDARQAEIWALPKIGAHKAALLAAKPRFEESRWYEYEPGREHIGPEGERIIATKDSLIYLDANGAIIGEPRPNGGAEYRHPTRLKEPSWELFDRELARAAAPKKNGGDDDLLEVYIAQARKGRGLADHQAKEARDTLALFKEVTKGMAIKDATRADGRRVVEHLKGLGLKSATIQKRLGWLVAMSKFAIDEGRLKFNAFSGVAKQGDDAERRLPLSDDDIAAIKANLDKLRERDQLLLRLLATTGMRFSEAYQIKEEMTEGGCRYVVVGTKNEQSLRRVPLPQDVLPFLPTGGIKGPLFTGASSGALLKRFSVFLDKKCGITDPNKTLHSLRHRAADKLRAAECPTDIRYALLGHEKKTIADGYGAGFAVPVLRKWIDKIGF